MIHRRLKLLLILLCGNSQLSVGFNSFLPKTTTPQLVSLSSSTTTFGRNKRPVLHASSKGFGSGSKAAKEDESKKEFNKALTELQNDGVPLLACDADQVHTLNAALWTTMAEMSDNNLDQKTCLVLEKIPLDALKAFTEDYVILKNQIRLIEHLPELQRISVSLVGNGAGPAILLETSRRTQEEIDEKDSRAKRAEGKMNEASCTKALKKFVERMVIGEEACPYTKTVDIAATGLEARGITPGPVAYRFSDTIDVCGALASFWTSVCELLSFPESEISTTVLSLPGIGAGTEKEDHERFAAIVELVSRNLCLFRGDSVFGLVHFHPCYDRNLIGPVHKAAYGHLREYIIVDFIFLYLISFLNNIFLIDYTIYSTSPMVASNV